MPRKPKKLNVSCPNTQCRSHNKVKMGNIILYGHKMNGTRNYRCTECGRQFVRTVGTAFYWRKLPKKEVVRICKLLVERLSFRAIARVTHHKLDTIAHLAEDIAQHCEAVTDWLLHDVGLNPIEVDEMWSYVKKNKKKLSPQTLKTMNKVTRTLTSPSKGKAVCT
ncbi:MAG: IS1 family transposase [Candidatus Babeliaceae bacterium]|nr:IS1 family transposase [Candidatus Babeliaceae bacterium]